MPQIEGNRYTYETVSQMLKGCSDLKRKAKQLEFEITNYIPPASGEDIIDSMTFKRLQEDGVNAVHKGIVTDKTANIAVVYSENARKINIRNKQELQEDLRSVNVELLRIEYYIGLINEKQSKVLSMLYIEGLTYTDTAEKIGISITSLKKLRKAGITKLVDMYNTIIS